MDDTVKSLVEGPKTLKVSVSCRHRARRPPRREPRRKSHRRLAPDPSTGSRSRSSCCSTASRSRRTTSKRCGTARAAIIVLSDGRFIDLSALRAAARSDRRLRRHARARRQGAAHGRADAVGLRRSRARLRRSRSCRHRCANSAKRCAISPASKRSIRRPISPKCCGRISAAASTFLRTSAATNSAASSPTTWASARRCRCSPIWRAGAESRGSAPNLVVCPTSVTHTWVNEAARFTPDMKVVLLSAGAGRDAIYKTRRRLRHARHVVRARAPRRRSALGHRISLRRVGRSAADQESAGEDLAGHQVASRPSSGLALTGTPIENSVLDLWSIVDFVMPGLLGNESHFRSVFETPIMRDGDVEKQTRLAQARAAVHDPAPEDAGGGRPAIAHRAEHRVRDDRCAEEGVSRDRPARAARDLARSRRTRHRPRPALHPCGAHQAAADLLPPRSRRRSLARGSKKRRASSSAFLELIDSIVESGHRVLVFSSFTEMLGLMREALDARKLGYSYLDGATKNRQKVLDDFKREDGPPIFLMSLKAGGVGLTVTEADYVDALRSVVESGDRASSHRPHAPHRPDQTGHGVSSRHARIGRREDPGAAEPQTGAGRFGHRHRRGVREEPHARGSRRPLRARSATSLPRL